jgi:small-conductance mechanosensitive channel
MGLAQVGGGAPAHRRLWPLLVRSVADALRRVAIWGCLVVASVAQAQTSPGPGDAGPRLPEPLTREAIRELVARLSDAEVRRLLIAQLDRSAAPAPAAPGGMMGMVGDMEGQSSRLRARAGELLGAILTLPKEMGDVRARFLEGRGEGHLLVVVLAFLAIVGAGLAAERLLRHFVRDTQRALEAEAPEGLAAEAGRLLLRLALELVAAAVFVVAAVAVFLAFYQGHPPTRRLVLVYLAAVVVVRLVAAISRLLLAPAVPALRLLPLADSAARCLHVGLVRLAAVHVLGTGTLDLFESLGLRSQSLDALRVGLATLLLILALDTMWRMRAEVGTLIARPGASGPLRRLAAGAWPLLATAYLVAVYVARVVEILAGGPSMSGAPIASIVLLLALPLVDLALCRVLRAILAGRATGAAHPVANVSFEPVLRQAVHVVVIVGGLLALAGLWDLDLSALAERGLGSRIASALLGIAITVLLAWVLWALARTAIDRRLAAETGPATAEPGEEGGAAASRLRTLLPLLRMLLLAALVAMATLSILAALGVNILPLLAGASVVGLAVGFGAQTLVKDVISGMFFLIDDAFRLGEYIQSGSYKGTVEAIGLRAIRVRHHRGSIYTIPYGGLEVIQNLSRDWVVDKLTIGITYDSDLDKVRKLIKTIGQELAQDSELAPHIIETLKMQGVEQFGDFAIQIRLKMKTKPGQQFPVRRRAYTMIKKAFDASGIRFAFPTVQVAGGGETTGAVAQQGLRQIQPSPEA